MHNLHTFAATFLLAWILAAQPQVRTVIARGTPSCTTCVIELTRIATVGKADDPILLMNYSEVKRGPRNMLIVTNSIGASPSVLAFDSTGRFVKEIGRQGQGPGEFSGWSWYLGMGRADSLYFRDRGDRYQVFAPSFEFGRPIPFSDFNAYPLLALPNGNFIVRTYPRRGQPYAHQALLVSPDGVPVRPFGFITPEEGEAFPTASSRSYSLTRDRAGFLVARRNQYDIQRFTLDGQRNFILTVENSPWMIPWMVDPAAPFTEVEALRDAGQDRVWVIGRVPAQGATRFTRANTASWGTRREETLSTIVELIDLARGSVIASRRFEKEIYYFVDHDHVARQRQDSAGIISWDIFRVGLRQ